jgi:hypothetical protein
MAGKLPLTLHQLNWSILFESYAFETSHLWGELSKFL